MTQRGSRYHPALKHALTFASGIASAHFLNIPSDALLLAVFFSLLWIAAAIRYPRLFLSLAVAVTVAVSGALFYTVRNDRDLSRFTDAETENVELVGVVVSDPIFKEGRVEWTVEPDSLLYRNSAARLSGDVIVRLYDSAATPANVPVYGTRIALKGTFRLPSGPRFPGEFDYGAWLISQGIAGTFDCYRRTEIYAFGQRDLGAIEECVRAVRGVVQRFAEENVGGEEGDILMALLLGDRREIDRSTRDAFAQTGTSHVLAVSGLHVGIIALALFICVSWIRGRWFRFGLFTALLVAYVLLVGSPPSVLRAAVMALVFLFAYNTGRLARPVNTLGVSALVLLLIEPAWLFDVGFQLSFAAVAGILLLYAPLVEMLSARFPRGMGNFFLGRIAQLLLLSFSAQLFTLPLTLYYFGYVSLASPLINLLVVPITTFGLGAGIAGVLASSLPGLPVWFGGAAWLAVHSARVIVEWSASFQEGLFHLHVLGPVVALLLLSGVIYLSLSQSWMQGVLRTVSFFLLFFVLLILDRRFDPLADSGSGYVYMIPLSRTGGVVAAVHHGDSLLVCYGGLKGRDSASAVRIGSILTQRIGAQSVRTVDLSLPRSFHVSPAIDFPTKDSDLRYANRAGPEYLSTRIPILLSNTMRRSPGFVILDGTELAQIPLQRKISRGIVLDPWPAWRIVEWE